MKFGAFLLAATVISAAVLFQAQQGLPAQTQSGLSVRDAIDLYARGEFDAAARIETSRLLLVPFTDALDTWVAEGDAASIRLRRRVAATFALEASWAHAQRRLNAMMPTNADTWPHEPRDLERWRFAELRAQGVLAEWIMRQLQAPARDDADQELTLAAVSLAQDGRAWHQLESVVVPKARALVGDHPRVRLASVIARTNRDLGPLRVPSPPSRLGVLRDEGPVRTSSRDIGRAIDAFASLLSEPALAGEAELRIGYLEMRRRQWHAALARFDRARNSVTEPILRATADYFAGFVHEELGAFDAAIEAYRRALAIVPDMRNVATRLAALLYLRGDRSDGYGILDRALNARPVPLDLLFVFERADARLIPDRIERLRKAIR